MPAREPDVGVAVVPTLQAFEILMRMFPRSGKMYRYGAITTEVEIAHEMLHRGNRRTLTTKQFLETGAEAVAL